MEEPKFIKFRADEDFRRRFKAKAAKEGITSQHLLQRLAEAWVQDDDTVEEIQLAVAPHLPAIHARVAAQMEMEHLVDLPREHRERLLKIAEVLKSEDVNRVDLIDSALLERPSPAMTSGLSPEHRALVTALVEMLTADPVPKGLDSVRAAVITLLSSWQMMTTPPKKGRKSQNE